MNTQHVINKCLGKNAKVERHEEDYCDKCLQEVGDCETCKRSFMVGDNIKCTNTGHKHTRCK